MIVREFIKLVVTTSVYLSVCPNRRIRILFCCMMRWENVFCRIFPAAGVVFAGTGHAHHIQTKIYIFPNKIQGYVYPLCSRCGSGEHIPGRAVARVFGSERTECSIAQQKSASRRGKALDSIPSSFSEGDGQTAVLLEGVGHERGVGHRADNAVGRIVRRERCLSGIYRNCKRTGDVMTVLVEDVDGDIIRFVVGGGYVDGTLLDNRTGTVQYCHLTLVVRADVVVPRTHAQPERVGTLH